MQPYQLDRISVTLPTAFLTWLSSTPSERCSSSKLLMFLFWLWLASQKWAVFTHPLLNPIFHHVLGKSILFSARASLCRKEAGHTANGRRRHSGRTVSWTSAKLSLFLYVLPATLPCWWVYTYYIYVFLDSILPCLYVAFFLRHVVSYLCLSIVQS